MAEPANTTAIVPVDGEYLIDIKEFDAAGKATKFSIPIPTNVDARTLSMMVKAGILGKTTWKGRSFPEILHAVAYSENMGLDIMAGDVYPSPDGRLATTAGAKIRHAMNTGRITGYEVQITDGPQVVIDYQVKGEKQQYKGPNLHAKVSVNVKGWEKPVTYEATLAEWFVGTNPNWRTRPAYMLRRNALSKAFEEVAPMGISPEEAPELEAKV